MHRGAPAAGHQKPRCSRRLLVELSCSQLLAPPDCPLLEASIHAPSGRSVGAGAVVPLVSEQFLPREVSKCDRKAGPVVAEGACH
eukprot:8457039-Alexandrium_andersonii.AAC.1